MSKTRALYHIVFPTYQRFPAIPLEHKRELYAYIFGILNKKKCYVHRINGMADHIHILIDLNPTIALADLIRDIKRSSSLWMNENHDFLHNTRWGKGYYAFTLGEDGLEDCIEYIKNQEIHHQNTTLLEEVQVLARRNSLSWHEDDWA